MDKPIMADVVDQPQSGDGSDYPYAARPPEPGPKSFDGWPHDAGSAWTEKFGASALVALGFAFVFASGNFAVCPLMEVLDRPDWRGAPVFCFIGAILAQAGLVSAALVFGGGPFWVRMLVCWGAALFLWSCWAAGLLSLVVLTRSSWSSDWFEVLRFTGLSLPLVGLAIQLPLWGARCYLGWRLTRTGAAETARPLSIGDYFSGTAVVAISITCARLAPHPTWENSGYWTNWSIVFVCIAGVSLLAVIPAMLAMFRLRDWRIGLCLLLLYGFLTGVMTIASAVALVGPPGGPAFWEIAAIVIVFVSLAAFLGGALKATRDLGYELALGRSAS